MKYTIVIEETVVKGFTIKADTADKARRIAEKKYKTCQFVLDLGECQYKQMAVFLPGEEPSEWFEF